MAVKSNCVKEKNICKITGVELKNYSENESTANKDIISSSKSDGEITDDETSQLEDDGEDLPEDFFDDFSDQNFLAGLDILCEMDDEIEEPKPKESKAENVSSGKSYNAQQTQYFSRKNQNFKPNCSSSSTNNSLSKNRSLNTNFYHKNNYFCNKRIVPPNVGNNSANNRQYNENFSSPSFEKELKDYVKKRNCIKLNEEQSTNLQPQPSTTKLDNKNINNNEQQNKNVNKNNINNTKNNNRKNLNCIQNKKQFKNKIKVWNNNCPGTAFKNKQNLPFTDNKAQLIAQQAKNDAANLIQMANTAQQELNNLQTLFMQAQLQANLNPFVSPDPNVQFLTALQQNLQPVNSVPQLPASYPPVPVHLYQPEVHSNQILTAQYHNNVQLGLLIALSQSNY